MGKCERLEGGIYRRLIVLHFVLYLLVVAANGLDERDEGYTGGKNFISEFFLPINGGPIAPALDSVGSRQRREVEGSGDDRDLSDTSSDKVVEDIRGTTENPRNNATDFIDGSGDHDDLREDDKTTDDVPIIGESENITASPETLTTETTAEDEGTNETTTTDPLLNGKTQQSTISQPAEEDTTEEGSTMTIVHFFNTISTTAPPEQEETTPKQMEETTVSTTELPTTTILMPVPVPEVSKSEPESPEKPEEGTEKPEETSTLLTLVNPATQTEESPVTEVEFSETKLVHKSLEASPGNIIQKKNMSVGVDPQLIVTDTEPTESEAQMDETVSRKLGAYIVIALILLSFSSLIGYIMMRKRQNRKRRNDFEGNAESHDTEKALLSLSDYKDHTELEENHLKNNEISPIVVKSNSQINRFEKNTNFSSPKNLNTVATEKNVEKDNVLKSTTTENLSPGPVTQATVEDSPEKESGDEANSSPNMEKLIVKTRIDQDSIPKKPIIINRSSTGYVPIPQDNS